MAQPLLNVPNVAAAFKAVRRETMAKRMGSRPLADLRDNHCTIHDALERARTDALANLS